jgi:hypothetical protein
MKSLLTVMWRVLRWLYGLKDSVHVAYEYYDLIVPIEYGALDSNNLHSMLPDATVQCLKLARNLMLDNCGKYVVWGSTDYYGPGAQKLHCAKDLIFNLNEHVYESRRVTSNNSIQEADEIHKLFPEAHRVLLICDWRHARRLQLIWRHFYPHAQIDFLSVDARWDEKHPSSVQKSTFRWLLGNIMHQVLIRLRGIEKLRTKVHAITPQRAHITTSTL